MSVRTVYACPIWSRLVSSCLIISCLIHDRLSLCLLSCLLLNLERKYAFCLFPVKGEAVSCAVVVVLLFCFCTFRNVMCTFEVLLFLSFICQLEWSDSFGQSKLQTTSTHRDGDSCLESEDEKTKGQSSRWRQCNLVRIWHQALKTSPRSRHQ